MDNKMNDFVNKMGAAKGLGLGMKLVAGVGLVGYGLANSMFTGNIIILRFSFIGLPDMIFIKILNYIYARFQLFVIVYKCGVSICRSVIITIVLDF